MPGPGAGNAGALAAGLVSATEAGGAVTLAVAAEEETQDDSAWAVHKSLPENSCKHKATDEALRNTIMALLECEPLFLGARILTESTSPQAAT